MLYAGSSFYKAQEVDNIGVITEGTILFIITQVSSGLKVQ